ncbi:hypothetical protein [Micromonospora globbae]|uniref:hypothetical protein n=1 Tax=Micromonospora globbae TaxID=1894969 RepID=UPI001315851E|nr:hypothetical protein [Micromonospora globbae]
MSSDAGQSSTGAALVRRLALFAHDFYAERPRIFEWSSWLLARDTLAFSPERVAGRVIEPVLLPVYFVADDPDLGVTRIARRRDDDPHTADPIRRPDFDATVCDLLAALPDPPAHLGPQLAQAVADTRAIARFGRSGAPRRKVANWCRRVADEVRYALDDEGTPDDVEVIWRETLNAPEAVAKRAATVAARRAGKVAAQAAAEEAARRFLLALPPGRHPMPEVWRAYDAAADAKARVGKHRLFALGRELFGDPVTVRGVRLWNVPAAPSTVLAELLARTEEMTETTKEMRAA